MCYESLIYWWHRPTSTLWATWRREESEMWMNLLISFAALRCCSSVIHTRLLQILTNLCKLGSSFLLDLALTPLHIPVSPNIISTIKEARNALLPMASWQDTGNTISLSPIQQGGCCNQWVLCNLEIQWCLPCFQYEIFTQIQLDLCIKEYSPFSFCWIFLS